MKQAVIIEGGLGGLTTSIYLAHAGLDVKILEKSKTVGGKLQQVNKGGFHFDLGPSTITLKYIFEKVFRDTGRDSRGYLTFYPISPIGKIFFLMGMLLS